MERWGGIGDNIHPRVCVCTRILFVSVWYAPALLPDLVRHGRALVHRRRLHRAARQARRVGLGGELCVGCFCLGGGGIRMRDGWVKVKLFVSFSVGSEVLLVRGVCLVETAHLLLVVL